MRFEDLERVLNVLRSDQPWRPQVTRIWNRRHKRVTAICPVSAIADEFGIPWEVDETNTAAVTNWRICWSWHYVLEWIEHQPTLSGLPVRYIQVMFDTGSTLEQLVDFVAHNTPVDVECFEFEIRSMWPERADA